MGDPIIKCDTNLGRATDELIAEYRKYRVMKTD